MRFPLRSRPVATSRTGPARRTRTHTAALLLVLAVVAGCADPIEGEPVAGVKNSQIGPPIESDTVSLRHDYDDSSQDINDYWTDDRRKDAKPKETTPSDTDDTGVGTAPDAATGVLVDPSTGPVNPVGAQLPNTTAGDEFAATGLAESTLGRLYITFDDGDYVCSATVVSSASKNTVITAAHCLWDFAGDTGWGTNVMFVPHDSDDSAVAPYGRWFALSAHGPQEFADTASVDADGAISGAGWAYDFAFLTMAPDEDSGLDIQDVTGGQGISFGTPAEEIVVVGYPSAEPFDGTSERYCASEDWFTSVRGAYGIECDMTQGASGGAWLTNYDPATGSGYLVATTSFRGEHDLGGMPLGASALDIFTAAGGL
ncbi:trypsin-like serine peptidase [Sanguibacter antarcticus]|uniref:V8-like Glu-specific endopeptidase n=1 Tax=Sanguibacter antarcticus TaxID=372484 RepID=A0A2A9E9S5_9MICO|nr:trypsin-like peptidase domain-containing protein [Sanguibacter antarcticus]PFG34970.1 hypothetical protein ATL42_2902 [Sanguibacter antarcticus]